MEKHGPSVRECQGPVWSEATGTRKQVSTEVSEQADKGAGQGTSSFRTETQAGEQNADLIGSSGHLIPPGVLFRLSHWPNVPVNSYFLQISSAAAWYTHHEMWLQTASITGSDTKWISIPGGLISAMEGSRNKVMPL